MSFAKYPKNWRANGYGWHNQEILNNVAQSAIVSPPSQKSQYPQQNNHLPQSVPPPPVPVPYGYPPAPPAPSLYPPMPGLPSASNGSYFASLNPTHDHLLGFNFNWINFIIFSFTDTSSNLSYGFQANYLPYPNQVPQQQQPGGGIYPGLPPYGGGGGVNNGYGIPGLPSLPGTRHSSAGPAMPPLPGMMPHIPQTYPPLPTAPAVPGMGPSRAPSTPSPAAAAAAAVEPPVQGISETPCQAVHVPPEENFFTVSQGRRYYLILLFGQFPYLEGVRRSRII